MKKTVFITGASQGLGLALATYFAEREYMVALGYNSNRKAADKLAKEITENGGSAISIGGDISDEADVKEMFRELKTQFGQLDVMINNARFDPSSRKTEITDGQWWDMNMNVSLKGTYLCCLEALDIMRAQSSGSIVNISSIRGIIPNDANRIPYGAAKAGQISLTKSFAQEAAKFNVRVNVFLPGAVATENLLKRIPPEKHEQICKEIPLGRPGTMEEMCHGVLALAENTYMTGTSINCSGGLLMN